MWVEKDESWYCCHVLGKWWWWTRLGFRQRNGEKLITPTVREEGECREDSWVNHLSNWVRMVLLLPLCERLGFRGMGNYFLGHLKYIWLCNSQEES